MPSVTAVLSEEERKKVKRDRRRKTEELNRVACQIVVRLEEPREGFGWKEAHEILDRMVSPKYLEGPRGRQWRREPSNPMD